VKPSLAKAGPKIARYFQDRGDTTIYQTRQLQRILTNNRADWKLAQSVMFSDFLAYLLTETPLNAVELASQSYQSLVRYVWGVVSHYKLALSIRHGSYLSHGTAVLLHGLTDEIPKIIYVNSEQRPKKFTGQLTQIGIDRAFSGSQRQSKYIFTWGNRRAVVISGKHSGNLEVAQMMGPDNELIDATKLERTLIDIVVRPSYAGGILSVLEAYARARDRASVNVLLRTLRALDYVYPYHQAIGFLMERVGFPANRIARLRQLGMDFDFYLAHGVGRKLYDSNWRLFYPKGL
jgi:predicted transcriptional regulator of viral defense system